MERPVSFDVTDYYYPDGDPISGPSSPPIHLNPEIKSPEDTNEYVTVTLDIHEDRTVCISEEARAEGNPAEPKRNRRRKKNKSEIINRNSFVNNRLTFQKKADEYAERNTAEPKLNHRPKKNKSEVKPQLSRYKIRNLSSSANNLSTITKKAGEYASLIMEVLDPHNMGYIMVESLKDLLLEAETQPISTSTQERQKLSEMLTKKLDPLYRGYIMVDSLTELLLQAETHVSIDTEETQKLSQMLTMKLKLTTNPSPLKRWYRELRFFVLDSWQRINGPYGATSQNYKKYKVVLLISVGNGAIPMIGIIKDIINNIDAMEHAQLNQMKKGSQWESQGKKQTFKTRRAYFYWVAGEQGSYGWFKNIMNEIAERDRNKVIEIHNYWTSVFEEDDACSRLIHMLQSINFAENGEDIIISRTRVMSHFARPNWEDVYKQIVIDHPETDVGVFYCGLPVLTKELRNLALEFTHKTGTRFSFHDAKKV